LSSAQLSPVSLGTIRKALEDLRTTETEIVALQERLKKLDEDATRQRMHVIPDMFERAEIDRLGMPQSDDQERACDAVIENYYHANIAKSWHLDKRQAAFAELKRLGADDLIQTDVIVSFPKASTKEVRRCVAALRKAKFSPTVEEGVPWARLTSWLREHIEAGRPFPKLDAIGAIVGRIVRLKFREEG
jgi:hypothetical protein